MINVYFFIAQSLFFLLATLFLLLLASLRECKKRKIKSYQEHFKKEIFDAFLEKHTSCALGKVTSTLKKRALLQVLEELHKNYTDPHWYELESYLSTRHLSSVKGRYRPRLSWKKRSFIARCIRINPELEDKALITSMLHDSSFFIRSLACESAIKLLDKALIIQVLQSMLREKPSSLCTHRAIFSLMKGRRIVDLLLEIYTNLPKEDPLRLPCLEGLTVLSLVALPPQLTEDLHASDAALKQIAARLLAKQARDRHLPLLQEIAHDPLPYVRQQAAEGLAALISVEKYPLLEQLLQDPEWGVRLAAAESLAQSGAEGRTLLAQQDRALGSLGYDVARYVLARYKMGSLA